MEHIGVVVVVDVEVSLRVSLSIGSTFTTDDASCVEPEPLKGDQQG
jgi:hypothetical protein